jgi:peptidoglycan/LPS O-acetylase OafA/YrhL
LGGASLLALAAAHSIGWSGQMTDSMGWGVNAVIVLIGALMIVTAPALRHTRALQSQYPGR